MTLAFLAGTILPALLTFLGLIGGSLLVDWLLHAADLAEFGRWLGPLGVGLLALSFLYSLRRRKVITAGSPKALLAWHETLGWLGALVLLVHGGIHLNAVVPWLALAAMVVVVASGLTGKVLLAEARKQLAGRRRELEEQGMGPGECERRLLTMALLTGTMQRWRSIHMPLTMAFAALALVHVAVTLLLW
jgi:hypothetical protein